MNQDVVISLSMQAMELALKIGLPLMLVGMAFAFGIAALFAALSAAGAILDLSIGFSLGGVVDPLRADKISQVQALKRAEAPMREFMFDQTRTKDLALFAKLGKLETPEKRADIPTHVLIPAFVISELKTAFQIGFLIFLPFLIIDLVVASTLMSMGMMMLPPIFISLPFKILLFVLVDGWNLVTRSLVESFS